MTLNRPFKVLGIQQIAIGGPDKTRLQKLWVDMLGLTLTGTFKSERENVDEDICAIGEGPFKVEVDLMQPLDPEKKPAVHTTPLNHVGLWIDNLPVAVQWLTAQGVRFAPGGIRKGAPSGHKNGACVTDSTGWPNPGRKILVGGLRPSIPPCHGACGSRGPPPRREVV